MPTHWITLPPPVISPEMLAATGGNIFVATALLRRGIATPEAARAFLDPEAYTPASARELPDMEKAAGLVLDAIQRKERILVWGDFDVDGQTATAILYTALRDLGADVRYYIPVRANGESHGISAGSLREKLDFDPSTALVLTCDTGITAHEAVALARARGLPIVVTDHHVPEGELPAADALVASSLLPDGHPLATLSGAGVAYKLVECLYERAGKTGAEELLDLAAIGMVTDVVPLVGDTRYLVQKGLALLRAARRPAVRAMLLTAGVEPDALTEETIGFAIGPRLNALGKMADANPAVGFLTTRDETFAASFAAQIDDLNEKRQRLRDAIAQDIEKELRQHPEILERSVIVVSGSGWAAGLLGNAASGIAERYGKPVIVFVEGDQGLASGSARSAGEVDIIDAIRACADLLASFGGHRGAAGLALRVENLSAFAERIDRYVADKYAGAPAEPPLAVDHYVHIADLSAAAVSELLRLAPFGAGNPRPVLAVRDVKVALKRRMGAKKEHLRVHVQDAEGKTLETVFWNGASETLPEETFDLAFRAGINRYRGESSVQGEWLDARILADQPEQETLDCAVFDHRSEAAETETALKYLDEDQTVLWAEGASIPGARRRDQLVPARRLVIWTAPAGRAELLAALRAVAPQEVLLYNHTPNPETPDEFLKRLAGLCKHAIHHLGGSVSIETLAGATGQSRQAVTAGLEVLEKRGWLRASIVEGTAFIEAGKLPERGNGQSQDLERLRACLAESAAFRRLYPKLNPTVLLQKQSPA